MSTTINVEVNVLRSLIREQVAEAVSPIQKQLDRLQENQSRLSSHTGGPRRGPPPLVNRASRPHSVVNTYVAPSVEPVAAPPIDNSRVLSTTLNDGMQNANLPEGYTLQY